MSETVGGFIKAYRSLFDPGHWLHPYTSGTPACPAFAWLDMIAMAAWRNGGRRARGELGFSERFFASRWHWTRGRVRRFLDELEAEGSIKRQPQTGRKPGRITICNYTRYQDSAAHKRPTSGTTDRPARSTKDEEQEGRKNSPSDEFEAAWATYPKRDGGNPKKGAWRAWQARLREGVTAAELFKATEGYRKDMLSRGKVGTEYVMQAATFYGPGERWKDYTKPAGPTVKCNGDCGKKVPKSKALKAGYFWYCHPCARKLKDYHEMLAANDRGQR